LNRSIAFFDFDGTITTKDTMLEFAKYSCGINRYWKGMCLLSPWLLAMKMGLLSKQAAKEKLLAYFFKNTPVEKFNADCNSFTTTIIPQLIRSNALAAIDKHKKENTDIVIVSASAENWVGPWCIQHNLKYICTKLEVRDNTITGKLAGKNCNGSEKVSRIKKEFDTAGYTNIYCYGDSKGDLPMLALATESFYKPFHR
jgi:phosphatidylglycerophosphatase C